MPGVANNILIDTNVLIRAMSSSMTQHQEAKAAVDHLRMKEWDLTIVPQVLYEFWAVATRPVESNGLGQTKEQSLHDLQWIKTHYTFLAETSALYGLWETLIQTVHVSGENAYDARLIAAMRLHQIDHLLTFNAEDFRRYSFIRIIDPALATTLIQ